MEDMVDDKFKIPFNFLAPDEYVPNIERNNRMLAERYRCKYHCLPYDLIPRQMIRGLISRSAFNRDLFIKKGGCSRYFSSHNILTKRYIDYNKHLAHSFGSYVIPSHEENSKNNPKPRDIDTIFLQPPKNLQGG